MKNLMFLFLLFFGISQIAHTQTLNTKQIASLKKVMWKSIHNLHKPDGASQFSGSFDWHSDVHAHWALLSIARVTRDADLEKEMMSILTIERLETEFNFLMAPENIHFEKPYGRTWMLLLLWELNHREISKNGRFQKIRWELTQDMLQWLTSAQFPEQTVNGGLIGTHDSWLMSLFLLDTAKSKNPAISKQVTDLIQTKMNPLATQIENKQMDKNDFLYLPALKYLINPDHRYQNEHLNLPTNAVFACHYPGAIQVSLWAQASQCARHDQAACANATRASQDFFEQTQLWKNDFNCVAHRVPQFTWMTHWLSLGKP